METTGCRSDAEPGDALASRGWVVLPRFFDPGLVAALRDEVHRAGLVGMRRAGIGRGRQRRVLDAVRGDWIRWLDGSTAAQREFLERLEDLRIRINRALMLGLFEVEAHFALYPPGTGYECHLDAFQQDNPRRLSAVLYLNRHWRRSQGGTLAIHDARGQIVEHILPEAGTMVLFLSQTVPHAVLPTRRWRASIAAWFRVRDIGDGPGTR
ncbi:2OG-Fe(II) oxygenase [Thioalkalivibrio nitratireducens DSM 14787]|uniref:2OG-Fe(II) oxygenase n=1 Tax=Thioalkalivibrio nitratireducens (strain DSM 14787 / UNIQEM 213 / ALEN2) TaxID=1255043 RepID=L0E3F4_THIND|nr:2OG-Fe(II) oxygenase [Thioalkalivibrio nitratireducens DSM 14787]